MEGVQWITLQTILHSTFLELGILWNEKVSFCKQGIIMPLPARIHSRRNEQKVLFS